jgi:hypothetical protein
MKTLARGYSAEIDQVGKAEWSEFLQRFDDANIYQTWSYGSIHWGKGNLSHLVLKKYGSIVAAVQSQVVKLPFIGRGIAYITGGPLWLHGKEKELGNIRQMARALLEEYVLHRGLLLRVLPNQIEGDNNAIRSIFEMEGFRWRSGSHRSSLLDLKPSLEILRKGLRQKWRNSLNRAEKNGLKLVEGTEDKLYEAFIVLYNEMLTRKGFSPGVDINEFRKIQKDLPDDLKMRIMICEFEEEPVSALVGSLIGNRGIYLLGATGDKGLKLKGSYLLQWRMIQWLKEHGARWYDLGGIDPDGNPGVYHFKTGLGGVDVKYLGCFESSQSLVSSFLVKAGDQLMITSRKLKPLLSRIRHAFI